MIDKKQFQSIFLDPLMDYFGDNKLPEIKRLALYEKLCSSNPAVLVSASLKIILKFNPSNFPDYDKIQEIVTECHNEHMNDKRNRRIVSVNGHCGKCNNGVRIVDDYAFRCYCPLGLDNYPTIPLYTGQAPFKDKIWETETDIFRETRKYIYRTCKATRKQYSVLKEHPWKDHFPEDVKWTPQKENEKQVSKSTYLNKMA